MIEETKATTHLENHPRRQTYTIYAVVALMIFVSEDTLLFGTNIDSNMQQIGQYINIGIAIIAFLALLIQRSTFMKKTSFLVFVILCFSLWFSYIFNGGLPFNYIYRTSLISSAYLVSQLVDRKHFFNVFEMIVKIIAVFSIISYIVFLIMPNIIKLLPPIENSEGVLFQNALFSVAPIRLYSAFARSYGIFREPGVFIVFLIFALYINLFEKENFKLLDVFIYVIAIILTFSTTGYVVLPLLFLVYLFKRGTANHRNPKVVLMILFVGVWILLSLFSNVMSKDGIIFSKLNSSSSEYSSGASRLYSILVNGKIFLNNPLYGVGAQQIDYVFRRVLWEMRPTNISGIHNTNTILMCFSAYGVLFGAIIVFSLYRFLRRWDSTLMSVIMLIVFFLLFSGESMLNNVFFYIVIVYGMAEQNPQSSCGDNLNKS